MVGMRTKFQNKLQLSNSLRLKITRIDVDVDTIIVTYIWLRTDHSYEPLYTTDPTLTQRMNINLDCVSTY
jgi:hypothetical protein